VFKSVACLQAYEPYLRQRWADGCRNAQQLLREIKTQGYSYSGRNVNRSQLRRASGEKSRSFRDAERRVLEPVMNFARVSEQVEGNA
jgi:transposase